MPYSIRIDDSVTTQEMYLTSLECDIVDAVCEVLEEVSNVTLKTVIYKQYRRGQQHCIEAIKGVRQYRIYHAPASYQITSAFGGMTV